MGGKLKISEIFSFEKGPLQSSKNEPGEYDFITASSEWKTHSSYAYDCEALLVAVAASGSLGRTHYVEGKFIGSDLCFILTPKDQEKLPLNLKLYYHIFNAVKDDLVYRTATGSAKKAINKTNFSNYEIPYFDIETQNKYAKLFDDFVVLKKSLENEILSQEQNLSKLRQSILQDAVQGKLTKEWRAQNPTVEPASELLKKIKTEKEQLIKNKKIKKEKALPKITEDEIPFEIPESWEWCRFGDLVRFMAYGTSQKTNDNSKDVPVLRMGNITSDGSLQFSNLKYISPNHKDLPKLFLENGDLVFNRTNSYELVGKSAVYNEGKNKYTLASYLIKVSLFNKDVNSKYINNYIISPPCRKTQIEPQITAQTNQANFSGSKLKNILVPLPNQEEQKIIVEKVNQLLTNCDVLEQEIQASKTNAEKLMQSVLNELLGEENNTLVNKTKAKKEVKKPSREIKYNSKTLLMDLVKLLKENGKLHAEDLWKMSKFPNDIDAFYAELKKQIEEEKAIKEVENEKGYLELA